MARAAVWRAVLLAVYAFALVQGFAAWWMTYHVHAVTGIRISGHAAPHVWRISVAPASAAYDAGLRSGDLVDAEQLSAGERYRLQTGAYFVGTSVAIPLERAGRVERVEIRSRLPGGGAGLAIFGWLGGQWLILWAFIVAWRRGKNRDVQLLTLVVVLLNLGIDLLPPNWVTLSAFADFIANNCANFCFAVANVALTVYACSFARPLTPARRALAWASYAVVGFATLVGISAAIALWTGLARLNLMTIWVGFGVLLAASPTLPYINALAGFAAARGTERERLGWVIASLSLWWLGSIGVGLAATIEALHPAYGYIISIANFGEFLASAGLTYALFNRRLLDLGFVVNRAAVFTVVSLIVVGIFVLVEWALSAWFEQVGHVANLLVSAALALALGFSVRAIHVRVDKTLDAVFFRKRHEDENALRTFARQAPYITELPVLLERAEKTLEERANAASVSIELHDGNGRYGTVSENDPALVALRSSHHILDLQDVDTALQGEFAYPMVARGHLVGALVLGPKRSGESYAPDESDAIEQLAHGVATAVDVLSLRGAPAGDHAVLESIRALQQSVSELNDLVRARLQ